MITQPEYLTKDRLKAELKKSGVSFDPNENKDYYVQLYKKHIMRGKGGRVKGRRSEFSSDEELTAKYSLRRTEKQQVEARRAVKVKVAKVDTYLGQVQQLTDQELLEELRELSEGGEEPGPITDTTRAVYQRQVARHMAEKAKASSKAREEAVDYGGDYMGEWSSGASEEESEGEGAAAAKKEKKVTVTRKVVEESRPSPRQSTRLRERVSFGQEHVYRREKLPQKTPAMAQSSEPPRPKQKPQIPKPKGQRGGAGAWSCNWSFLFSFLLLVVMFVATFLAYDHYTNDNSLLLQMLATITATFQGSNEMPKLTKE